MTETTVIRDADWIVAHDGAGHAYASGDVAWTGNRLVHVGGRFDGAADHEISGRGRMVMPGLVNIHSHPASEPMNKGFLDELGSKGLYLSSLYEFMPLFRPDADGARACVEVALSELMQSGVTTVVDLSMAWEGWLDVLAGSGMRAVAAPMHRAARWFTKNGHSVEYEWDVAAGREAQREALAVVDAANAHPSGRLSGMVAPSQIDTCDADLIRDGFAAARERGAPFQIHAAQSSVEFLEMTRRHGRTPIEWLHDLGVLAPGCIIGHGIFLNDHPGAHWATANDFDLLRDSGAAVAHCPTVFQRRGITLRTFGRYRRAGIPVGIGTDTYPHNMLEELRAVLTNSRVISRNVFDVRTADAFDAATTGGAAILGRDDIGRLSVGAKADLVVVDVTHPAMRPVREPLRSLIYVAAERAVRDVWVDGRQVVAEGRALAFDLPDALERLEAAQRRAEAAFRQLDYANRPHEVASPFVYGRA